VGVGLLQAVVPARIKILECLREGEKSAGDIMEELGMEQSNGSQHLAVLRNKEFGRVDLTHLVR
jgi:DNA-binding transcriptional ArsR family regulator